MSDRRSKLEALAGKRKSADSQDNEGIKKNTVKKSKSNSSRSVKKPVYSDEEEDEEEEESDVSDEEEEKVVAKPKKRPIEKKKKRKTSDDDASDEDKSDVSETELETLDTSLIIPGGRRTRGKKIDYKQFGADPEDEE
ncbi:hypothetical protein EDC96DRAFT_509487 [Choanephora cucurbitarum]|nr:hypothetical protein EDC96DRAFT_509487 [Choanephora cucurbitarum]